MRRGALFATRGGRWRKHFNGQWAVKTAYDVVALAAFVGAVGRWRQGAPWWQYLEDAVAACWLRSGVFFYGVMLYEALFNKRTELIVMPIPDIQVLQENLAFLHVCTPLPQDVMLERLNRLRASGTTLGWEMADPTTVGNGSNPCPCDKYPTTHQHFLLVC